MKSARPKETPTLHEIGKKYAISEPLVAHGMKLPMILACAAVLFAAFPPAGGAQPQALERQAPVPSDEPFHAGKLLFEDDFQHGLRQWRLELQQPGIVWAKDGVLNIDVPAGATLWFRYELKGPVMISYQATVISAGGPNDRVSDLNCFWMATDPAAPRDIFAHPRSGVFAEYNSLLTYYVGLGGNGNTTTRFRRYIGSTSIRPLLPQNDLTSRDDMIVPNHMQQIRLVADGSLIQFYCNQKRLFQYIDPHPYTDGWFAIRTTKNHMQIRNLRIFQLIPNK
jgi:hypothetical protein